MKDLTIPGSRITKEFTIWLMLFIASFLVNVYAIITHDGIWTELFTQLHIVAALSVVLYLIGAVLRSLIFGMQKLISRNKQ